MNHKGIIGVRYQIFFKMVFLFLFFQNIFRLAFFFFFKEEALSISSILHSFYIGLKFDLRISLILSLLWVLFSWIFYVPFSYSNTKKWSFIYSFIFFILLIFFICDFAYYSYLQTRINATVINFLYDPSISFQMLWQTYPIFWLFLSLFISTWLFYVFVKNYVFVKKETSIVPASLYKRFLFFILVFILFIFGIYGRFSQYPLRWSEAYFSTNNFLSYLAMNPIHNFFDTLKNKEINYDFKKVLTYYPFIQEYFNIEPGKIKEDDLIGNDLTSDDLINDDANEKKLKNNQNEISFARPLQLSPIEEIKNFNVVIIIMESLASYKTSFFENPLNPTPYLKEIADKSYVFNNFWVSSEGTARSIFSFITSIPDVSNHHKSKTSSRNPLVVDQNTLIGAFKNYKKFYFIGGSANWGNIRGILTHNIKDLTLYEGEKKLSKINDVWGISDYDLFKEANRILNDQSNNKPDKPFFAIIQSAGFHRPYTIPENIEGFEVKKDIPLKKLKQFGFNSIEEYNSLRFQDYSMGNFFQIAKESSFFNNTIFVIFGDHGLPAKSAKHMNKGYVAHKLERFHVPLIFYSPEYLKYQEYDWVFSEVDILPTLCGILNLEFINTSLGNNIFYPRNRQNKYAFFYMYHNNPPQFAILDNEYYMLASEDKVIGLYNYKDEKFDKDLREKKPQLFEQMKKILYGYYYSSQFKLYHNKKMNNN